MKGLAVQPEECAEVLGFSLLKCADHVSPRFALLFHQSLLLTARGYGRTHKAAHRAAAESAIAKFRQSEAEAKTHLDQALRGR